MGNSTNNLINNDYEIVNGEAFFNHVSDEDEDDVDPFAEDEAIEKKRIAARNLQKQLQLEVEDGPEEVEKEEDESLPLFKNYREQLAYHEIDDKGIESINFRIDELENKIRQAQYLLSRNERIPYEYFLVLRLLGNISYATRRQVLRYLGAWRNYFQWHIDFSEFILRSMAIRGLVAQVKKPVMFKKGVLKGKSIKPYYLTAKGKMILDNCEQMYVDKARFGEPNAKMMERLRHEVLISEVYIHHIEQGNYVYWIMNDEDLRREKNRRLMQNIPWKKLAEEKKSIGDFRLRYYDRTANEPVSCDGEVAVRYTAEQILNKGRGLKWYCYDEREAEKINFLTREKATILDKEVLCDEDNPYKSYQKGKRKCPETILKWLDILGGLTIQTAAILGNIHYKTAVRYLKSLELQMSYTSLMPGMRLGRGVKFFSKGEIKVDDKLFRDSFALNNAIQAMHERGCKIHFQNGYVRAEDGKKRVNYRLYCDSQFYNPRMKFDDTKDKMKEKIYEATLKGENLLICISDAENHNVYSVICPDTEIFILSEHQYKYEY